MKKLLLGICLVLAGAVFVRAEMKSSVSHWGITWTFDKAYECGQFVTDDWWVIGPVTITAVSPAPSGGLHGTVVDPVAGEQGYDDRTSNYNASVRASFPLSVSGTKSVVSTISKPEEGRPNIESAAVLTVVTADPGTGAFRPQFLQGTKTFFKISDIRLDLLPGLRRVPTVTDAVVTEYESKVDGIWLDHIPNYVNRVLHPERHMANYSRDFAVTLSNAAVILMLDNAGKDRKLLYHFLQRGIDWYGHAVGHNALWPANGGHANGRKWPIVFAGIMFQQPAMRTIDFRCNEDEQTYYGNNGKALWGHACGSADYFLNGCSGSGDKACRDPEGLVDGCGDYRNCCTSHTWMGAGLAALIMGAENDWDHDAHFDYLDRWLAEDLNNSSSADADYGGATIQFAWLWFRNNAPYVDYTGIGYTGGTAAVNTLVHSVEPNPMTDQITFNVESETRHVASLQINVFDHAGNGVWSSDGNSVSWDGFDDAGRIVNPGVYFYRITSSGGNAYGRIIKAQ